MAVVGVFRQSIQPLFRWRADPQLAALLRSTADSIVTAPVTPEGPRPGRPGHLRSEPVDGSELAPAVVPID